MHTHQPVLRPLFRATESWRFFSFFAIVLVLVLFRAMEGAEPTPLLARATYTAFLDDSTLFIGRNTDDEGRDKPVVKFYRWDIQERKDPELITEMPQARLWGLAISADKTAMVTLHDEPVSRLGRKFIATWDCKSLKITGSHSLGTQVFMDMAFCGDANTLVNASGIHGVQVWDVRQRRMRSMLLPPEWGTRLMATSGDGKRLAVASSSTVTMWEMPGEKVVAKFTPEGIVGCMACSTDGSLLLIGDHKGAIDLWDVRTGKKLRTVVKGAGREQNTFPIPENPAGELHAVAFSPNGELVGAVGEFGTLVLINLKTNQTFVVLEADKYRPDDKGRPMDRIAFSPDGTKILTGTKRTYGGKHARVWEVKDLLAQKPYQ